MATGGVRAETWKTPQVVEFLQSNGLGALAPVFEENEVTGLDLTLLTEGELQSMLKISPLQAAKIKTLLIADSARPADEDPGETHDFTLAHVPRISARMEDLGDADEQSELHRASRGVDATPLPVAPPPPPAHQPGPQPHDAYPSVVGTIVPLVMAAPAAVLPTGTGALRLDAGTVERYQRSVATITTLEAERVAQELPGARSRLKSTQKRLKLQEDKFEGLRKEEAKCNTKVDELVAGKWYPGKYIMGSRKREEKIDRHTEKREQVSNQVRAAGAQLEELNAAAASQARLVSELTAKCASLDEARGFCASLLQSAFAGGAVGDDHENGLEIEVAGLGPRLEEVRRYKAVYGKAYEVMRGSSEALEQARQLLQSAAGLARADMIQDLWSGPFQNTPGGLMVDMMKRNQMRQGVELCRVAGDLAIKARAMVPDMPRVKADKLNELRTGFGLMDVVFDNIVSDMVVARKIRDMQSTVVKVQSDIRYAERWLDGWLRGRIDADLQSIETLLAAKRAELHEHRLRLMHRWIEARARGAVQEAPPPQQPPFPHMADLGVAMGLPVPARTYIV